MDGQHPGAWGGPDAGAGSSGSQEQYIGNTNALGDDAGPSDAGADGPANEEQPQGMVLHEVTNTFLHEMAAFMESITPASMATDNVSFRAQPAAR